MSVPIKTMKLYRNVTRVYNELRELGVHDSDTLTVSCLSPFDQYHYEGTSAVAHAIDSCGLRSGMRVLDIGAGIGGPERYLAASADVAVTAVELQEDHHTTGVALTARCQLAGKVTHVCGDFLKPSTSVGDQFDAIVSWLTFLHIPDRTALFERCFAALRPGGRMYIEDYVRRGEFASEERTILREQVFCTYLPTQVEYIGQVTNAGFVGVEVEDVTAKWGQFVRGWLDEFRSSRERHLRVHEEAIVKDLDEFYAAVVTLFEGKNLGGVRLVATKPL